MRDIWNEWLYKDRWASGISPSQQEEQAYLALANQVIEYGKILPNNRVLDIGTGDGLIGKKILRDGIAKSVTFQDISSINIEQLKQQLAKEFPSSNVDFIVCDAKDIDLYTEEKYDRIFARAVYLYITDLKRAFTGLYNILKPGGTAIISEPINKFNCDRRKSDYVIMGYDFSLLGDLGTKVYNLCTPKCDELEAMSSRSAEDYFDIADEVGFSTISAHTTMEKSSRISSLVMGNRMVNSKPNPFVIAIKDVLPLLDDTEQEQLLKFFENYDSGKPVLRSSYQSYMTLSLTKGFD